MPHPSTPRVRAASWPFQVARFVARGGWDRDGRWTPLPYVEQAAAAELFRHKVFRFLHAGGLLTDERIELLLSWRHSGFSVHNTVTVAPDDGDGLERLARYLLRSPVSLERLTWDADSGVAFYRCRQGHEPFGDLEHGCDAKELLARVLMHIPDPRRYLVRSYGAYSNMIRARRRTAEKIDCPLVASEDATLTDLERRALRRVWAALIRRIYEVDPLVCPRCGKAMRIIAFITEPKLIGKILRHLETNAAEGRSPPPPRAGIQAA